MNACDRYLNAIHERVDGTLGPIRRAELELHLESCDACRALAADLEAIARTARSLDQLTPPDRVWKQVAGQLRAGGADVRGSRLPRNFAVLALAAALVLAVGASLFVIRRSGSPATGAPGAPTTAVATAPGNAAPEDPVQGVARELALTEQHFQNVIEQASTADPATAAVLKKNLLVMNEAIAESRKALDADPQSGSSQLYEMLKQKIRFLQNTIALMNEMRQGDAAGAAQIVESGKS